MTKVEAIEETLGKLSAEELRQVRDWLDDILEDELDFTDEFQASIERGESDLKAERVREVRT